MENKTFTHEGTDYTITYTDGRPDKYYISFQDSDLGLECRYRFKRLIIDGENEKITTEYAVDFYALNGERVITSKTLTEQRYITSPERYLEWIGLLGPAFMCMLSDNICEDTNLPKQYLGETILIIAAFQQLNGELDV